MNHLSAHDFLTKLDGNFLRQMKDINVDQLMSTEMITVSPYDTLKIINEVFQNSRIHHIPVVFEGELVGIVSNTDLERAVQGRSLFVNQNLEQHNETLKEITVVSSIMTKNVKTIPPSTSVEDAYKIFKNQKYRSLIVTSGKDLIGILTPMDYLDYFFENKS